MASQAGTGPPRSMFYPPTRPPTSRSRGKVSWKPPCSFSSSQPGLRNTTTTLRMQYVFILQSSALLFSLLTLSSSIQGPRPGMSPMAVLLQGLFTRAPRGLHLVHRIGHTGRSIAVPSKERGADGHDEPTLHRARPPARRSFRNIRPFRRGSQLP